MVHFVFIRKPFFEKSRDLYFYYLVRPYKYFLKENTAHIVQKCTNYVNATVAGYMTPFLLIIAQSFTTIFLLTFLIFYQPILTLSLVILLGLFYMIVFGKLKRKITSIGKATPNFFKQSSKEITDTFETYKEFAKEFESLNFSNKIAVAISGGPDSIALSFLISCYRFKKNPKTYV